jgi:hypothetical protein
MYTGEVENNKTRDRSEITVREADRARERERERQRDRARKKARERERERLGEERRPDVNKAALRCRLEHSRTSFYILRFTAGFALKKEVAANVPEINAI